jgi:hypothetical protein
LVGEVNDTGPPGNLAKPQQLLESVLVMDLDLRSAARKVAEGLAVGREHSLDVGKCGKAIKRLEILSQWVIRDDARNVWSDRRQHLVAREEYSALFVVEAKVIVGMSRGKKADPLPATQAQVVLIGHTL